MHTTCFWNNLHQVRSTSNNWKAKIIINLWQQETKGPKQYSDNWLGLPLHQVIISLKINVFSSWYGWKIAELALKNKHSLTHSYAWGRRILVSIIITWCRNNSKYATVFIYKLFIYERAINEPFVFHVKTPLKCGNIDLGEKHRMLLNDYWKCLRLISPTY